MAIFINLISFLIQTQKKQYKKYIHILKILQQHFYSLKRRKYSNTKNLIFLEFKGNNNFDHH